MTKIDLRGKPMTETTEEKVVSILEDTNTQLLNAEQIVKNLKAQVTSLTKERDKALVQQKSLEEEVDAISRQLDYEKAAGLAYRKVDVLKNDHAINLNQRYYKDIQELNSLLSKAEEENKELKGNSEIFYIDPDDPYVEERSSLELAASMVGFNGGPVAELQVYAKKRLPNVFIIKRGCEHKAFTTKEEALASLNKEGEEK